MSEVDQLLTSPEEGGVCPVSLSCRVYDTFEGLDHLRGAWDAVVLQTSSSIYMTYDWVRIWWNFYGESAELRLFVFAAGERLVGIVPIYIDTVGHWPLRLRIARLVGSNIPPKVFNPPVEPKHAEGVLLEVVRQTVGAGCDLLSFGPVCESEGWETRFRGVCTKPPRVGLQKASAQEVHSIFELPGSIDEYYRDLAASERKHRRRDLRQLEDEYGTNVEVIADPTLVVREFDRFAEQHRRQWVAQGQSGHFGGWPRALEFNRLLVEVLGKLGRVRFLRLLADRKVIASNFTFMLGRRQFWELPARELDAKWERLSIGSAATVMMVADSIAMGIEKIEGGLGHYEGKTRLGARNYSVATFRVVSKALHARARFALFTLLRACVCIVYHKIWYRRLTPKLPAFFVRPQWRWWLRLDF